MNETNLMDYIPPEQLSLIISAIVTAIASIVGAVGVGVAIYVRSMFKTWAKEHESKRKNDELEREAKNKELEAKIEFQRMEIQARLDTTETGRETQRLWMSQLDEERRDNAEQRKAFERREAIHIEAMQGIQNNTAATLGILKEMSDRLSKHQESDETMEAQQIKIIAQGETTHERLSTMAGVIDAIVVKLDNITATKKGDEKVLQDIHKLLSELKESFQRLESSPVATSVAKSDTQAAPPEIQENQKELKKEDSQ